MLDHASLAVRDLSASTTFYTAVLAPLGLTKLVQRERTVGFGKRYPELWLNLRRNMHVIAEDSGHHICLRAPDEEAVRCFHAAALANGGRSEGEPGPRPGTMTDYFAAFIRDPDGNRIEAATFPPGGKGT